MSRKKSCCNDRCCCPSYGYYGNYGNYGGGYGCGGGFGGWWIWILFLIIIFFFWNGGNKHKSDYCDDYDD